MNDRRRAARTTQAQIGRQSFLFLLSCAPLPCLLFILLLLMSGNVCSNLFSIFFYSLCTGNAIWTGISVHCCTCFKWEHSKCTFLSSSEFSSLSSSQFWSCPSCCISATPAGLLSNNSVSSPLGPLNAYTSTVHNNPLNYGFANAAPPLALVYKPHTIFPPSH